MSERDPFDVRWERLAASARRAPMPEARPRPGWVERLARQAQLARASEPRRTPEPLAWAGLMGLGAVAVVVVLLWPGPVAGTADALVSGAGALPRSVPHAPRLPRSPAAPRPPLPSRDDALAALSRLPGLTLDFPFLSRRTETP